LSSNYPEDEEEEKFPGGLGFTNGDQTRDLIEETSNIYKNGFMTL
jgi:hypothetical protein